MDGGRSGTWCGNSMGVKGLTFIIGLDEDGRRIARKLKANVKSRGLVKADAGPHKNIPSGENATDH